MKIKKNYDVIVAGSGPAGMGAAIKAARLGAKTLLIEWQGSVGGVSTVGMMSHFAGNADSKLYRETLERASEKNFYSCGEMFTIDPEMLKITYFEMLEEAGVDVLLYSFVYDVVMDGDKVVGVCVLGKSGIESYGAKVVIDCTGDGDVAFKAGAEYYKGHEESGQMQPVTLMFKVAGVDMSRAIFLHGFESKYYTEKGELQALAKELLPHPAGHVLLYESTIPGVVTCNMTNVISVDGTSSEDLTRAEITCRKQMIPIIKFLREYVPGYENCYIISSASFMGVRETRHFVGKYTITENDILEAKQFDDWVVRDAFFNFDVHNMTGSGLDKTGAQNAFTQTKGYTIPYNCLLPKKVKGLLLCGRNISGTHMAHSNFRVMPICLALGEAAGAAAAISALTQRDVSNVNAKEIQEKLI